jgi:major membrane immunogen (membrane-anchored lipoprotein)
MKTFLSIAFAGLISLAGASADPVDTAGNVVHSTVRGTKKAAKTVAHGAKKAADTVADALTPDSDARRVDVTVTDGKIDMPTHLESGKTAFVVKNDSKTTQNFEVRGEDIDRKFVSAPNPGETKVLHVTLEKGTYRVYSPKSDDEKPAHKMTLHVK